MKPKNFPARKLLRQIKAKKRQEKGPGPWPLTEEDNARLDAAYQVRTKKRRSFRL